MKEPDIDNNKPSTLQAVFFFLDFVSFWFTPIAFFCTKNNLFYILYGLLLFVFVCKVFADCHGAIKSKKFKQLVYQGCWIVGYLGVYFVMKDVFMLSLRTSLFYSFYSIYILLILRILILKILKRGKKTLNNKMKNKMSLISFLGIQKTLRPEIVAEKVAYAWQNLDASVFEEILGEQFDYFSYAVANPMNSREEYIEYITGKFSTFKNNNVSFNAEVKCLNDGKDYAVILINEEYRENPAMLVFNVNEGKIYHMFMRPVHMFSLKDLEDKEKFNQIIDLTGRAIHKWVDSERQRLGLDVRDVDWYQDWPIFDAPSFQHMCFRLGNNVYSLYITICGSFFTDEQEMAVELGNVRHENQIEECNKNNLIACDLIIDVNGLCIPSVCEKGTENMIALSGGDQAYDVVAMSEWEINATAVNNALSIIRKLNPDFVSYTNVLTFKPQIFYKKDEKDYYVYVDGHHIDEEAKPINIDQIENQPKNLIGQFFNFGFSAGFMQDRKLSRRGNLLFKSDEYKLIPIEDAIEKFGSIHDGAYFI